MEDNKKPSSLPANYITLVQLQERWLEEKERKLKEKEQQEKQKEKEHKQKQKRKLQAQNAVAGRRQPDSKSPILCRLEWNQPDKPEPSVSEVKIAVDNKNVDQEGKSVNSKNNKKKTKYRKKKKNPNLGVEDEVTEKVQKDGVVHKPPAKEEKEDVPGTRNKESRGKEGKFRAKSSSNLNQANKVEIETKFRDLSVNVSNGKGYNEMKRTSTYNDRSKREFRGYGSGNFHRRLEVPKPRDAGLIWVKKGETLEGSHSVSGR